jgi:hypothetical protein
MASVSRNTRIVDGCDKVFYLYSKNLRELTDMRRWVGLTNLLSFATVQFATVQNLSISKGNFYFKDQL